MNLKKYLLTLLIMLMLIPSNIVFAATGKEYVDSVPVLELKEVTEDSVSMYLTIKEYDSSDPKLYCKIERREGETGQYKEINGGAPVECTTNSLFVDKNLKSNTKYYYRAMLTIGHSPSAVLCATTLSASIPTTSTTTTTTTTTTHIVEEPTTEIITQEVVPPVTTEKIVDTGTTENVPTGVEDYAILGLSVIIITLISLLLIKRKNRFKKEL